jgi:diguanylate cyclase (GGDEF)-like protein
VLSGAQEDTLKECVSSCGVPQEYVRVLGEGEGILLRLDDASPREFVAITKRLSRRAKELVPQPPLAEDQDDSAHKPTGVVVGAMSERAQRAFVDDMARKLVSYMRHKGLDVALLTGNDRDLWSKDESGIEILSANQLQHMDPFTGMLNINSFLSLFQEVLETPELVRKGCSVIYFDIDDFKSYNRTFGRRAGDQLLLYAARQISSQFEGDLVAHVAIDRFVVASSKVDVVERCASINKGVSSVHEVFSPQIKCGICPIKEGAPSSALAMDCAKAACESIKGRNDIVWFIFNDEMFERISLTRYIAHTTTRAVREGWIKTFFQPVVDAKTGELCGYEALCRWQDPERGMLSPGTFIPMLEDAHLIHQVDLCMLERVCSWISSRLVAGEPVVPISINLSRLDFLACDIVKTVIDACDRWCISHELLAVEVTESALSGDDKSLRRDMERFREAGFEVWMDDFGSGYSSLNLLKDYEFDVLKIDMVFLRDMDKNTRARKIVRSVVDMAKNLGLKTLVEGVETTSQRDFMREIGCDFIQGYLFGRPEAID